MVNGTCSVTGSVKIVSIGRKFALMNIEQGILRLFGFSIRRYQNIAEIWLIQKQWDKKKLNQIGTDTYLRLISP